MPARPEGPGPIAYLEAAVLPVILGSTVVLAKVALADLGPLTLAALRFAVAALALLPLVIPRVAVSQWSGRLWLQMAVMGVSFYVVGNGALFLALRFIPATTAALMLSLTPLVVLLLGILWLREVPSPVQVVALVACVAGSLAFFSSQSMPTGRTIGILIAAVGVLGGAVFTVMVRDVARARTIDALSLTALPIALGAIVLLPVALLAEGPPHASLTAWIIVFTLALLNTVAAFLLYSHVLQRFTALTLATILNLNPLVTAVLAWIFLGNRLSLVQIAALLLVLVSAAAVQAADPRQESPRRRQA